MERVIGVIKNTVSKSITGPNLIKMDDEELLTWLNLVIQKINDRPLILGAPLGITLTPNHVLLGFRNTHGEEINPDNPVQRQVNRWHVALLLFGSLWTQEFARRNFLVVWKQQKLIPSIGDIVLFRNEPCYKHEFISCPDHKTAQETEWRYICSNHRIQKRGRRKNYLRRQISPPSLPLHERRDNDPGGEDPRTGPGRSCRHNVSKNRSSGADSGRVLQHRIKTSQ